jgi:hypothetical protein
MSSRSSAGCVFNDGRKARRKLGGRVATDAQLDLLIFRLESAHEQNIHVLAVGDG